MPDKKNITNVHITSVNLQRVYASHRNLDKIKLKERSHRIQRTMRTAIAHTRPIQNHSTTPHTYY